MRLATLALVALAASDPAQDAPLPRVLILGDSVYDAPSREVAELLRTRAEVVHPRFGPGRAATTGEALARIDELLGEEPWDLVHLNFGLADLAHRVPGIEAYRVLPPEAGGVRATPIDRYRANLEALFARLDSTGAKLVWASTTPIRGTLSGVFEVDSELRYNEVAAEVATARGIPVNDMHTHVLANVDEKALRQGPFWFDREPLGPPIARVALRELGLLRPVAGPVKVFVLIGGWSHIGGGVVQDLGGPKPGREGSLDHLVLDESTRDDYRHLVTEGGAWATRPDVWVQFDRRGRRSGDLGVGYGGDRKGGIGAELSLGHRLGDAFDSQVLLLKTALGTPSLGRDLRPPSSGETGRAYATLLAQIEDTLTSPEERFLDVVGEVDMELCGVVLNLGEQDEDVARYAEYLPLLIGDLRASLGRPDLPFVLVGTGRGGLDAPGYPEQIEVQRATASSVPGVAYVETRGFWPAEGARGAARHPSPERWFGNAVSFYRMGEAIGVAMLELLEP